MPNHEEHCADSLKRYGRTFSEVHRWMDEPCSLLGSQHRIYRHDPFVTPKEAKTIFGENADNACLDHIELDELDSRQKSIENKSFTEILPVVITVRYSGKRWRYECKGITQINEGKARFSYL